MDIDVLARNDLATVFRVLRSALSPHAALGPRERHFLESYAAITRFPLAAANPEAIRACDVRIDDARQRKRLVQLSVLAALLSHPVKRSSVAFVRELSEHLATRDPALAVLAALEQGRHLRVRLLAMRRGFRAMIKEAYASEGPRGVLRFFSALFFRTAVNKSNVWRYKRLGLLPDGKLGREYWKHMTRLGFGFPGEPAGIPASVAYHDIAHVLTGYDTTPQGEIQQGCFQGGNRREDGFFFVQFAILQFHHGIRITPVAAPEIGNFDPENVLWAIHRGATCTVDMTHQWDFWPLMSLSLQEARARCGLYEKPTVHAKLAA